MATIRFNDVECWYPGADGPSVSDLDLEIKDGEFMVLVGPSGCGKSTTLRMLAGLEEVTSGTIHIGDREVSHVPPKDRDIAMVFQNYALYPHMTVAENMAFALKMAKLPKDEQDRRVKEAAGILGLTDYLDRKPKALSGGQRQRVAMGRAIVRKPQVFLMDEPLSNLDAKMRVQTRTDIAKLQRDLGVTTVYVTHDQVEAMTMGDRVAVMNAGRLQQVDTPLNLYDKPANVFVAGFIGSPQMNLLPGKGANGVVNLGGYSIAKPGVEGDVTVGIRPEAWKVVPDSEVGLKVDVLVVEELGSDGYVYGSADVGGEQRNVVVRVGARDRIQKGQILNVAADPTQIHLFDAETGLRLGD
ncbi:ABC transporter ATP-binding protein [Nocardioides sp. Kera G14]|uniref:ABC transporter ATP-binding protein n=1 Tax=Nocardioides sp. Kera G14 TaxID=2884264 RepID=UPI001D10FF1D|nr:sn-glycerol-3-phosphate ABC transporter ATP-binding protein UgpC [Nocardioides sp. Kera G14]UDY24625.1 sn-glycerol-3-phosphate ABC transporter ATP-binding protein UgpC [Nocardioides sp. Kera G14]